MINNNDIVKIEQLNHASKRIIQNNNKLLNKKISFFDTVSEMKASTKLKDGMTVITLGYYSVNDGGGATYKIRQKTDVDIDDGGSVHIIGNLVAELIVKDYVTPEMFGAKGDGITDDTLCFQKILLKKYKIVCNKKKYFFNAPVDCSTINEGYIDINKGNLVNFHILINLNDEKKDWRNQYTFERFIIKNGVIGGIDYNTAPNDWNIPVVQTGSSVILENIKFQNEPYIMAIVDRYIDYFKFDSIGKTGGYKFETGELTLDAINYIDRDTGVIKRISGCKELAGDNWMFEACNGWYNNNNIDYKLLTTCRNNSITFNNIIQSAICVGLYSNAIFNGCHFEENNTMPTVDSNNLYLGSITFISCYLWGGAKIIDLKHVIYENCYFRTTIDNNIGTTLSDVFNGKDLYSLNCNLISCCFGGNTLVDTNEILRVKNMPKKTYNWRRSYRTLLKDKDLSLSTNSPRETFSEFGEYKYTIYLLSTSNETIAIDSKNITVNVNNNKTMLSMNINNTTGGYGILIYKEAPNGKKYKAIGWLDPNSVNGIVMNFIEYNKYVIFGYENDTIKLPLPWIEVENIPTIEVNNHIYELGGVIVTDDNSVVPSNKIPNSIQVNNTFSRNYIYINGISFNNDSLEITVGSNTTLAYTITPQNATNKNVIFTSSDETKVTVNNIGVVTGVAEGTATIRVTTKDGSFTDTCTVTVSAS